MRFRTFLTGLMLAVLPQPLPAADVSKGPPISKDRIVAVDERRVPACENPKVHKRVANHFKQKEREYWHSLLELVAFAKVREIAYRPWGDEFSVRRFCSAKVLVSDGRERAVYYSVIEEGGFIGATWGVEFCVTGLDRNLAYAPNCEMARP